MSGDLGRRLETSRPAKATVFVATVKEPAEARPVVVREPALPHPRIRSA